jgi:hypothetical protein
MAPARRRPPGDGSEVISKSRLRCWLLLTSQPGVHSESPGRKLSGSSLVTPGAGGRMRSQQHPEVPFCDGSLGSPGGRARLAVSAQETQSSGFPIVIPLRDQPPLIACRQTGRGARGGAGCHGQLARTRCAFASRCPDCSKATPTAAASALLRTADGEHELHPDRRIHELHRLLTPNSLSISYVALEAPNGCRGSRVDTRLVRPLGAVKMSRYACDGSGKSAS